ncbi:hypothetical protein OH77DRAFT_891103 [Trametes cingulata]|nr:hypothetical protein OH77DRAFT_891103 [Trametes cingulata]
MGLPCRLSPEELVPGAAFTALTLRPAPSPALLADPRQALRSVVYPAPTSLIPPRRCIPHTFAYPSFHRRIAAHHACFLHVFSRPPHLRTSVAPLSMLDSVVARLVPSRRSRSNSVRHAAVREDVRRVQEVFAVSVTELVAYVHVRFLSQQSLRNVSTVHDRP